MDATLLHSVGPECGRKEKACASTKSVPLKSFKSGTYSRKVFIGGLPPDLDAGKLLMRLCVGVGGARIYALAIDRFVWCNVCLPRLF